MDPISQVNRRKACDLCFTKKLRCDMLKPTCSNCTQYHAECKTTSIRRRVGTRPKQSTVSDNSPAIGESRIDGFESRLDRIEAQIQQVLVAARAALNVPNTTEPPSNSLRQHGTGADPLDGESPSTIEIEDPTSPRLAAPAHKLPPLTQILPVAERYFTDFNSLIPLFDQSSFMRMLHDWYSGIGGRSKAVWAAVNVVLALGSRVPVAPVHDVDPSVEDVRVRNYINNAQLVVAELMTRHQDLLGLQVLLGLVLLYQESKDPRPATLLIGAAIRLVHRCNFQSRDEIERLGSPDEGLHRSRLFWITYMLDKEISLRHLTPSLQQDADIDLELPSASPSDGVGDIYTLDGQSRVNYLRLRVQLAHIQGRTYELLYSNRSTKLSAQGRQANVVRLSQQLEKWRLGIPCGMQIDSVTDNLDRMSLIPMSMLHYNYLHCLVVVHGVWSKNADWIQSMSSYSRIAICDSEVEGARCSKGKHTPLPSAWGKCLQESRGCLRMARRIPQSDCKIWGCAIAIVSALIILQVNLYQLPPANHDQTMSAESKEDRNLISLGLSFLSRLKNQQATLIPFQRLHSVAIELNDGIEKNLRERSGLVFDQDLSYENMVSGGNSTSVDTNDVLDWGGGEGDGIGIGIGDGDGLFFEMDPTFELTTGIGEGDMDFIPGHNLYLP